MHINVNIRWLQDACSVDGVQRCMDNTQDYINTLKQFGMTLLHCEHTQHNVAYMLTTMHASRLMVANADSTLVAKDLGDTLSVAMAYLFAIVVRYNVQLCSFTIAGGIWLSKKLYVCIYLRNLFKAFSEWNRSKNTGISFPDVPVEVMNFEVTIAQTRAATIALALYHSLDFAQTNLAKQRQSIYILSIFLAIADHNILLQPTIVFILTTINHILSCIAANPKLAKS